METVITIAGLGLTFRGQDGETTIFEGFDLAVTEGEFVVIVGASGVGKSTLLRIIAGLLRPSTGSFRLNVADDPRRRPVALVFQDARLLPWRRTLANVEFGVDGLAVGRDERRKRARTALDIVGLAEQADRWPHQRPGQRQRVALARALAVEPSLLLMDEPFGALDAITRQALQDELVRVWQATGKTILFVTHDIDEAVYLADRIVVLGGSPAHIVLQGRVNSTRPRRRGEAVQLRLAQRIRDGLPFSVPVEGSAVLDWSI